MWTKRSTSYYVCIYSVRAGLGESGVRARASLLCEGFAQVQVDSKVILRIACDVIVLRYLDSRKRQSHRSYLANFSICK